MPRPLDLLQGTLDLLILQTLTWGPAHGYAIARWIEQLTGEVLRVGEGSLYPALHRMTQEGWLRAEWGVTAKNRQARFYMLTAAGRKQLRAEQSRWVQLSAAIARIMLPG